MRNLDNFWQAVEGPKSWNSMDKICLKTTFLHLKHYLQIYVTLLSTDLWFGKWHEEYSKFSPELESLKIGILMRSFNPKMKKYELKIHRGVICRDNEQWRKIWRGLVISKLTWGIWQILSRALEGLKNFHLNVLLLRKVYIVCAKKVQRSYLLWNWIGIQKLERNRLVVSKLT